MLISENNGDKNRLRMLRVVVVIGMQNRVYQKDVTKHVYTCGCNRYDCERDIVDGICEGCSKIVEDCTCEINEICKEHR